MVVELIEMNFEYIVLIYLPRKLYISYSAMGDNSEYNDELDDNNGYWAQDSHEAAEDCISPWAQDPYYISMMVGSAIIISLLCIWLGCFCYKRRKRISNNRLTINKLEEEVVELHKINDIEKDEDEEMEPEEDSKSNENSNTNATEPSNTI